jgi:RNA polymerase sigma-70 factor (ECF subfamily)
VTIESRRFELEAALGRVADGDRFALKQVYDLTAAKLLGVIMLISRDREQSEDVLQDVYLKVWHRAGRFDRAKASPITWLCAIARNSAIDGVRRDGRIRAVADDTLPEAKDDAPDAEAALCDAEERERLRQCLEDLQVDHRRSIRAAYFGGLTHSELAQKTGVPLGTMKSWIRRGLANLKACLSDG